MKYIITREHSPILFSKSISHSDMAAKFGGALSAGMVSISSQTIGDDFGEMQDSEILIDCYGESHTLKMKPDSRDEEIIKRMIRGY